MKLSCVIVEDEPMARKLLEQYVDKVPGLTLLKALSSPLGALELLKVQQPDILFLDVQMPEITGIDLLRMLPKKPVVVLTTAYSEYAIEGYELDVTDYLLKPITFERFLKCVERIKQKLDKNEDVPPVHQDWQPGSGGGEDYLFVKDGTKSVRINLREVRYIESMKDYVRIHLADKRITTLQSMKKLMALLPAKDFIRVHHSYIIALSWVEEVYREEVLVDGKKVPVSDTYRPAFKRFIDERSLK
ncbi:MAG: LytTR family DNA-binding domain-containing protein [Bacteroidota bacterium]